MSKRKKSNNIVSDTETELYSDNELDVESIELSDEYKEDTEDEEDIKIGNNNIDEDDECIYNIKRKNKGIKSMLDVIENGSDFEDGDDDENGEADENYDNLNPDIYIPKEERITTPVLTKYERVRLLGERTVQLSNGAKPMIKNVKGLEPRVIAQLELESKMMPIKINRPLPNGKKEQFSLSELRLKKNQIVYNFTGNVVDINVINKINKELKKGGSIIGYNNLKIKN